MLPLSNLITKEEAITVMKHGAKVTHLYFSEDEWVTMKNNFTIVTEEGYEVSADEFWRYRQSPTFDRGWSVLECPTVTPREDLNHARLSIGRDYKVLRLFDGSYQIQNDHGIIDYYSPSLFKRARK